MFVLKVIFLLAIFWCYVVLAEDEDLPPGVCWKVIRGRNRKVCCEKYEKTLTRKGYICAPICDPICENSKCSAPNECTCLRGFQKFSETRCIPTCENCDHGSCIGYNVCNCYHGYERLNNTCAPICSKGCENGICSKPDQCKCLPGYTKALNNPNKCEPICEFGCVNGKCVQPNVCECNEGYEIESIFSCSLAQPSLSVCLDCEEIICIDGLCIEPTGMKSETKFDDASDDFEEFADHLAEEIDEVMEEVLEEQVLPVLESFSESEEVVIITNDLDSEQEESSEFTGKCIETANCICEQIPSLICVDGVCDLPTNCKCVDGFQKQEDGQCVFIPSTTPPVTVQQASQSMVFLRNGVESLFYLIPLALFCIIALTTSLIVLRRLPKRHEYKPHKAEMSENCVHFLHPHVEEIYA